MKKETKCGICGDASEAWNESWNLFKEAYPARPLPPELDDFFVEEKPSWLRSQRPYRWALAAACAGILIALGLLYLSYVTAGRDFFYFQWDALLLETTFLAIFLNPRAPKNGYSRCNSSMRRIRAKFSGETGRGR